jgi:hypothetical protein
MDEGDRTETGRSSRARAVRAQAGPHGAQVQVQRRALEVSW